MKQQKGFVIVLISDGKEVATTPQIYCTGCYVDIINWQSLPNGLLGITVQAVYRAQLSNSTVRDDGLLFAEAKSLTSNLDEKHPLPQPFSPLVDTLKQLLSHPFAEQYQDKVDFDNTSDICYRLAELLPISNRQKQLLLESETSEQILDQLVLHIKSLQK
jgi:Lon protease-like protein